MEKSESSATIAVTYSVPLWLEQSSIEAFVQSVPEITRVRRRVYSYNRHRYDLAFDFYPGTKVYEALKITETNPYIYIDHFEMRLNVRTDDFGNSGVETVSYTEPVSPSALTQDQTIQNGPLKLKNINAVKPECYICRNDLDTVFSTPCWGCKNAQCYECIRRQFRTALSDFQTFPARCCQLAMHPDVAKGILPEAELTRYKTRWEEWLAKTPFYCPVPTCSTFIPNRLLQQHRERDIECPACQTLICLKCKQKAHEGQRCGKNKQYEETIDLMKKFGYKQCPKCGAAIGKMFGCSHVQCACGAHWCWDCRRKIEVCISRPCNVDGEVDNADFDGGDDERDNQSDIDSFADSDNIAGAIGSHSGIASSHTTALEMDTEWLDSARSAAQEIGTMQAELEQKAEDLELNETLIQALPFLPTDDDPRPELEMPNLDDPDLDIWQHGEYNFGSEPGEEDTMDMWGCMHNFGPVYDTLVPRYWMTASVPDWWERDLSERKIECMVCWESVKMVERVNEGEGADEDEEKEKETKKKEKAAKDWRLARRCNLCNIIVCRRCKNDLVK